MADEKKVPSGPKRVERLLETATTTNRRARESASARTSTKAAQDYDASTKDELQAEADKRGLTVKGTGADGAALKADLVKALEKDDKK